MTLLQLKDSVPIDSTTPRYLLKDMLTFTGWRYSCVIHTKNLRTWEGSNKTKRNKIIFQKIGKLCLTPHMAPSCQSYWRYGNISLALTSVRYVYGCFSLPFFLVFFWPPVAEFRRILPYGAWNPPLNYTLVQTCLNWGGWTLLMWHRTLSFKQHFYLVKENTTLISCTNIKLWFENDVNVPTAGLYGD